jgi:hypothetical protein
MSTDEHTSSTLVISVSDTNPQTLEGMSNGIDAVIRDTEEINLLSRTTGPGFWNGARDGQATTWIILATTSLVPDVQHFLRLTCVTFNQSAIGFIVGEGTDNLVTP